MKSPEEFETPENESSTAELNSSDFAFEPSSGLIE
jgi:hypothetical protein